MPHATPANPSSGSGEILEVCFQNGADVKEGDLLYRIDPVKYEAAVKN
ncbi:MAG: biotin/lipoyl-binding protein, partial [Clostridia bacterium]|nr:biotin/lipoyl-binding protein [Clostridia bacterium]